MCLPVQGRATPRAALIPILAMLICLVGCASAPTPAPTPTSAPPPSPVIDPSGPKVTVEPGRSLPIKAKALQVDSYEWTVSNDPGCGTVDPKSDTLLFRACKEGGTLTLVTVVVHRGNMVSAGSTLAVIVPARRLVPLDSLAMSRDWADDTQPIAHIDGKRSRDGCYTGTDCLRFAYTPGGRWGGTRWVPVCPAAKMAGRPDEAGEDTCRIDVLKATDAAEFKLLRFCVRGEQGGEIIRFEVGGADAFPRPGRSTGNITLSTTWECHEIPLEGLDLSNANRLFTWMATDVLNPDGAVFYLDDVMFEGMENSH